MEIIKSEKGRLTILTGKTDMGKSTITVADASEFLKTGQNVMFFSYEYCQSILYNKMTSHFGLSWSNLFHLNVVDAAKMNLDTLVAICREKKGAVDVIYIDYLDLLIEATYHKEPGKGELKEIQDTVATLANLAEELDIPVVLLSQMGSSTDFEKSIARLNSFAEKAKGKPVIKMFIGKGSIIDPRIVTDGLVHLILVDGYDLRHFSSINITEIYKSNQ